MEDDDFEDVTDAFAHFFAPPKPACRRARWADVPVIACNFLFDISKAVNNVFGDMQAIAAMHANFNIKQDEFHEQAAREIETLTTGDENG